MYISIKTKNPLKKGNVKMVLHNKKIFGITIVAVLVLGVGSITSSHAETVTGEDLKRNPIAAKILENIKKLKRTVSKRS